MKKFIIMMAAAIMCTGVSAQEESGITDFSLQQAVDFALANNKNLQNARQELIKSDESVWEAISQGLPQVDATLDYMTYFNYEMEFSFGGDMNFTPDDINAATTAVLGREPYSTVGLTPLDLLPHYAAAEIEQELAGPGAATIIMSDQMTAKIQVSQLVFSGQYIAGIQTAKLAKEISRQVLDNSVIDTKESVINAYYLTLISEASLNMLEKNLENIKEIRNQTEKMFEIGMAEQIDVDQFDVTVNQLENSKRAMQRNLQINYNMLRFILGLPAGSEIHLTDNLEDLFDEMSASELLIQDFRKDDNLTYQIMNSQEEINKKLWDMQKWNYGPTIAGFYNYNEKLMTTGFDMTPNHLAGFNVSLPIFSSGKRKAQMSQAKIDYEISQRNTEILGDQLELQNDQLKYNLESSLENYYTQLENLNVAERMMDNYKRKYEQGMASSLDVTQANSSYLEAESTYLTAMFEVMNARISLEKLLNNLSTL